MNQKSIFGIRQIFVNKNARWTEVGLAVGVSVDEDPPLERVKRWPVQWLRVWRAPIPYSIFVIDARGGRGGAVISRFLPPRESGGQCAFLDSL